MVREWSSDETLLLDLLNSTPIVDGEQRDGLASVGPAGQWLRDHGGTGSPAERKTTIRARDILQALVRGELEPDALTPLLADVTLRPSIDHGGVHWTMHAPRSGQLAARAVLAWDELRRTSPGRLRPCDNTECAQFLIDRSKSNSARWCSMATCGNRMKARRHYQRTRAGR